MRVKLGLAVASMSVASVLAIGVPATAQTTDSSTTTTDSSTTTTTATTTTTTTTTIVGAVAVGASVGGATPAHGSRSPTQIQLYPPPPPPTTTTTTLPPGPDYSLPANSGAGRRAVYSKSLQKVWIVDDNETLIKEHFVSGKQLFCDPYPGIYRVFSRSRYTFALQNPSIIWGYMIRFTTGCNGGNIGFHEIPTQYGRPVQSVSQLGTPLSGGCVRQAIPDAVWMWNWAQVGTTVVVLP